MSAEDDPEAAVGEELPDRDVGGVSHKMKRSGRYDTSELTEGQFEPGSQGRVLRNLIGIKRKREMGAVESTELLRTTERFIRLYGGNHRFTAEDLCSMHKAWLGRIYEWAGNYRNVNLAKGGFPFAAARLIPKLMAQFEKQCLAVYTPCRMPERNDMIHAISRGACGVAAHSPFPGRKRSTGKTFRILDGLAGGISASGFRNAERKAKTGILYGDSVRSRPPLRPDGEDFRRGDRMDPAAAEAINLPGLFLRTVKLSPKAGQEIPSIADEVATLRRIAALHSAGSCRYGFVSRRLFFFMWGSYQSIPRLSKRKAEFRIYTPPSIEMKSRFSYSGFLNNCHGRQELFLTDSVNNRDYLFKMKTRVKSEDGF